MRSNIFVLMLLICCNTYSNVEVKLGTSVGSAMGPNGLEFTPIPLTIKNGENISAIEMSINIYPFNVTDVITLKEVDVTYEQNGNEVLLELSSNSTFQAGTQLEMHIEIIDEDLWTYNCGFGEIPIFNITILDKHNQIIQNVDIEYGGWLQASDYLSRTIIKIVSKESNKPIQDCFITIKKIINGPDLCCDLDTGVTDETGEAIVVFSPILSCDYLENELFELELLLKIEPLPFASIQFEPIEIIQTMKINPDFNSNSLFLPVTIPVQTTSKINDWQMYD